MNALLPRCRTPGAAGFTLIEMVVSLAVFAVLIGAMGSAIVLSTHAMPTRNSDAGRSLAASEVLQQMADELRGAIYLTRAEPTSVAFVLPDQNGDGNPEAIRYAWSGVAGDPLTRQLNDGAPVALLNAVGSAAFDYPAVDHVRTLPGALVESDEVLLSQSSSGDDAAGFAVDGDDWIGFRIAPSLPAEALAWRVGRVLIVGRQNGVADGTVRFVLSRWAGSRPDDVVLEQPQLAESTLAASWAWAQVQFPQTTAWQPGETAAVTLKKAGNVSGKDADVRFYDGYSTTNLYRTWNGGQDWYVDGNGRALIHRAYGTYTTRGPDWTLTRQRTVAVDIALTPAGAYAAPLVASVDLVNAPDAVSRREADFNDDPTKQDLDFDGDKDWDSSGSAFSKKNLNGGKWTVEGSAEIKPSSPPLDEPLTLSLRMRDTLEGVEAGWCEVRFDRGNNMCGRARLEVVLAGGVQRFSVTLIDADGSTRTLAEAERPAGTFAELGLVVDPAGGRVLGTVDGEAGECLLYERVTDDGKEPSLIFNSDGKILSGVEVDTVTLHVGGVTEDIQAATPESGGAISNVVGGLFGLLGGGR